MMPESMREAMEKVTEHDEILKELKEQDAYLLKGHDALFKWKKEMETWRKDFDKNFQDLKLTIMQENKETRTFFQTIMSNQWDLIKAKGTLTEAEKDRRHEVNKLNTEIKRDNYSKAWDIIKIALGSTGIIYFVIQAFLNK